MSRSHWARGTFLLTLLAAMAGCQDYNFNPVGHCLIQPGSERVTLSNISSADVLFVVDDSGSMGGEQQELARNFDTFIGYLDQANALRRSTGLEPFDFHIAVTSSSMFFNQYTDARTGGPYLCTSSCPGAEGSLVCCQQDSAGQLTAPARLATKCTPGVTACPSGTTCGTNCISPYAGEAALKGENYCCVQGATTPATAYPYTPTATMPCSTAGVECGKFETHYNFAGCGAATDTNGVATNGYPYPQGDFVSWASGATANPRVLHFDKELYPEVVTGTPTNKQGFTAAQLKDFFRGGTTVDGNVIVGVCGSGQEQALGAARAAIEKARDGRQKDTYARASATPTLTWDPATRTASSQADWLTAGASSKLVVVFVGDEDDCSPRASDPSGAVVWRLDSDPAVGDSCGRDALLPAPEGGKLSPVDSFVSFFTGLGREVAAAFILPAAEGSCTIDGAGGTPVCSASDLCCPVGGCSQTDGAQARGIRLLATAQALQGKGVDVMAGSICDANFGNLLKGIADLVKPPTGLKLPSAPAAGEVTVLRIVKSGGQTRKTCNGPAPQGLTGDAAAAARDANGNLYDWWFTPTQEPGGSVAVSQYVYINPNGACKANPGETYSADYLGRIPAGGCQTHAQCQAALGGAPESWTCFAGMSGATCRAPTAAEPGTCICGKPTDNCPNG